MVSEKLQLGLTQKKKRDFFALVVGVLLQALS